MVIARRGLVNWKIYSYTHDKSVILWLRPLKLMANPGEGAGGDLELHLSLKHLDQNIHHCDHMARKINRLQEKILQQGQSEGGESEISAKMAAKLLLAYESTLKSLESLEESGTSTISIIDRRVEEQQQQQQGDIQVEVVEHQEVEIGEDEKELVEVEESGAESFLNPGDLVAVLCKVEEEEEEAVKMGEGQEKESGTAGEEWMLATVTGYRPDVQQYVVEDCELDMDGLTPIRGPSKDRLVPLSKIIRLNPPPTHHHHQGDELHEEGGGLIAESFPPKSTVLALFPGTTCLYPATVISTPSRRRKTKDYLLKFEDDELPSRTCAPRYIVPIPKIV